MFPPFATLHQLRRYLDASFDEMEKYLGSPDFPAPVHRFGAKRWRIADVDEWMTSQSCVAASAPTKRYDRLRRRKRARGRYALSWNLPFFGMK